MFAAWLPALVLWMAFAMAGGQVSLTLRFREGGSALVSVSRGQRLGAGVELIVLGNHGAAGGRCVIVTVCGGAAGGGGGGGCDNVIVCGGGGGGGASVVGKGSGLRGGGAPGAPPAGAPPIIDATIVPCASQSDSPSPDIT